MLELKMIMGGLRHTSKLFGVRHSRNCNTLLENVRFSSYLSIEYKQKNDPRPFFFQQEIQNMLLELTRSDMQKIFHKRSVGKLEDSRFEFLTDEQLQREMDKMHAKAKQLLQFPPAVPVRESVDKILSSDPALIGYESSKIVFTDITFGLKDSERLIVVRNPDGQLSEAEWGVRDRMNQVYFPIPHRQLKIPQLFSGTHFEDILNRKEYIFVLDLACQQFDPDDAEFQRVTSITYQHIYDNNEFEKIRSTRHFGSMTFFLVWNKMIDNLLLDLVETCQINEANLLVELYGRINNIHFASSKDDYAKIEEYIKNNSMKKAVLELALQSTKDFLKQKAIVEEGIKKAHGHS